MENLYLFISFLASLATAKITLEWLRRMSQKHRIFLSDDSSSTPRIGGIIYAPAVMVGVAATILYRQYLGSISGTLHFSTLFLGSGLLGIYLLGLLDDAIGISKGLRWCIQLAACLSFPACSLLLNNFYGFCGIHEVARPCSLIITFFAAVLIIEALQKTRDTEGIAEIVTLVISLILTLLFQELGYYTYACFGVSLAGAVIISLYYTLWGDHCIGTKISVGHCGRFFVGFSLCYLLFKYAMDNQFVMTSRPDGLLTAYSLILLPLFDYVQVKLRSMAHCIAGRNSNILTLQQKLTRQGFSLQETAGIYLLIMLLVFAINEGFHHMDINLTWIVATDIFLFTLLHVGFSLLQHTDEEPHTTQDFQTRVNAGVSFNYHGQPGLVSVIMPTWNSARYVTQSVESILCQTYRDLEIIITDDASSDETPEVLRQLAARDSRIRIILNDKNLGAGHARNCSIEAARGQYIAFCDSDDRWAPTKLEQQIRFMSQHSEAALCFCPYYTCDGNNEFLGYVSAPRRVTLFQMMCDNKIGFLTAIYDTHRLGKHLMPTQRKRQDHALLLTLLLQCRFAYSVQEPLAYYRIHAGNMSAKKLGLLHYNAQTYNSVFGWPKFFCYGFLFTFFLPTYFWKRIHNILFNIFRAQLA